MPTSGSAGGRDPVLRVLTCVRVVALVVALVLVLLPVTRHPSGPSAPGQVALTVFAVIVILSSVGLGIFRIRADRRDAAKLDKH